MEELGGAVRCGGRWGWGALIKVGYEFSVQFVTLNGRVKKAGAHYPERATPILSLCHGVFTDQFVFRTVFYLFFLHYH